TLQGQNNGISVMRESGRFYPLAQQEFNVVRHLTSSVVGYHAVPLIQLLILTIVLFFLDKSLSITARFGLVAVCLILPSIVYNFTGLVYPDRNVVFWLACLILFVQLFEQTRSTVWASMTVVAAQILLYYKETAFLLLLGFATARLALRCRRANHEGWDL